MYRQIKKLWLRELGKFKLFWTKNNKSTNFFNKSNNPRPSQKKTSPTESTSSKLNLCRNSMLSYVR